MTEFKPNTVYICDNGEHKGKWFLKEGRYLKPLCIGFIHAIRASKANIADFHEYTPADEPKFYDPALWGAMKAGRYVARMKSGTIVLFLTLAKLPNDNIVSVAYFMDVWDLHSGASKFITRPFIPAIDDPKGDIVWPETVF